MLTSILKRFGFLMVMTAILAACGGSPAVTPTPFPEGVRPVDPPLTIKDFTLTDQSGATRGLADLRGKYTVISFGYTNCPDICQVNLAHDKQVKEALGTLADGVNFVFVSVDGARDTPEKLAAYLRNFDATFIGLTGTEGEVRVVTQNFGVIFTYDKKSPEDKAYPVTHTASTYLLNKDGNMVRIYSYGTEVAIVADDIRLMMKAK